MGGFLWNTDPRLLFIIALAVDGLIRYPILIARAVPPEKVTKIVSILRGEKDKNSESQIMNDLRVKDHRYLSG